MRNSDRLNDKGLHMRISIAAKASVAAALAAASLAVAVPADASARATLTEVRCSTDKDQLTFTKFMGWSRCFEGVGDLDVEPTFNTEASWVSTGNHSGWFSYEPTPGDVKVQYFGKYQSLTGRFHPLRHIHVDG
ncbi:hypothetical protein [Streptomyces sp. JHA26]|uniref:hypothetical protein n=1 Tax=Streptomyces sp. JHA26 TaxID=1917143 RepID=UPI001180F616|nr:hypothetical protein [Streptomyces sp. JHA26]